MTPALPSPGTTDQRGNQARRRPSAVVGQRTGATTGGGGYRRQGGFRWDDRKGRSARLPINYHGKSLSALVATIPEFLFFTSMKPKKQNPNRVSKSQLSRLAGISRTTVGRYLLSGDAPRAHRGLYDKAEALQFLRTHVATAGRSPELERLRTRKLELEIQKVEHELAVAKGETVSKAAIVEPFRVLIAELQEGMREKFERALPPRLVGKSQIEIQLMLTEACDALVHALKVGGQRAIAEHGGKGGAT